MTKTAKKTTAKKASGKKAPAAKKLPDSDEKQVLPRGQERLGDGTIRLKTGAHDLSKKVETYDVHGARIELGGKVLIAGKDVDWLSIGKCAKCGTKRKEGIRVRTPGMANLTVVMFRCHNAKTCDLGGRLYVQVHSKGRFIFET